MEEDLIIREGVVIPGGELWFTASRAGGPGGQHGNKTSSRVTLHWVAANTDALDDPARERVLARLGERLTREGILQVHVEETRSQHRNREIARERLAGLVDQALKVRKKRIPTRISRAKKRRRVDAKKKRGEVKRLRGAPASED